MTEFTELIIARIKSKWGDAVVPLPDVTVSDDIADWTDEGTHYSIAVPDMSESVSLSIVVTGVAGDVTFTILDADEGLIDAQEESSTTEATFTLTSAELVDAVTFTVSSTATITGITITTSPVQLSFPPVPRFIDDHTLASSESSQYDVIYLQESSNPRIARGIGGKDRQEDLLIQLHLYGPNVTRGYKVRDEVERIIDDRGTRVRLDDLSLLFTDNRTRRAMKVGYGYVYDLRIRSIRGLN